MKNVFVKNLILPTFLAMFVSLVCNIEVSAEDCPRGAATPIVKRSVYPRSTFRLDRNGRTAVETVNLGRGDRLTIKHWGCEYYALTFRFVSSRFRRTPEDIDFWYRSAIGRLNRIYKGLNAPVDVKKGVDTLNGHVGPRQAGRSCPLELGDKLMFGGDESDPNGDDIPQVVSVDKVQKLKGNRYAVEITFTAGPL